MINFLIFIVSLLLTQQNHRMSHLNQSQDFQATPQVLYTCCSLTEEDIISALNDQCFISQESYDNLSELSKDNYSPDVMIELSDPRDKQNTQLNIYYPNKRIFIHLLCRTMKPMIFCPTIVLDSETQLDKVTDLPAYQMNIPENLKNLKSKPSKSKGYFNLYDTFNCNLYRLLEIIFASIDYPFQKDKKTNKYNLKEFIVYLGEFFSDEIVTIFCSLIKIKPFFSNKRLKLRNDLLISFSLTNLDSGLSLLHFSFTIYSIDKETQKSLLVHSCELTSKKICEKKLAFCFTDQKDTQ